MEEKLKIGIDLDDVVFEFVKLFLEYSERKFGKKILFKDVFSYQFADVLNVSLEEVLDLVKQMSTKEVFENMALVENSKKSILELSKKYEIYFITSRVYKEGTLESLKKHFEEFDFELIFSSNPYAKTLGKHKGEICLEEGINFMVEDSYEHANNCAESGIKTFLLDKPWNQRRDLNKNIIRVKNWKGVLEILNGN